jgi:hypothetical protein
MSLLVLLLSYKLCRDVFDKTTAAVAVFLLLFLRSGLMNDVSGIALLDMALSARYDIDQALWALWSVLFFLKGSKDDRTSSFILAGFFAALAVLSHLYAFCAALQLICCFLCPAQNLPGNPWLDVSCFSHHLLTLPNLGAGAFYRL